MPKSLSFLLGLCQRAGQIASGDVAAEQALKKRKAVLLLLAADASGRTREKYLHLSRTAGVPCYLVGTLDELGEATGKGRRAALVIQSKDFAKGIRGLFEKEGIGPVS